jgi:hypothetical protein
MPSVYETPEAFNSLQIGRRLVATKAGLQPISSPAFGNELSADLFKFDAGFFGRLGNHRPLDRPQIASCFPGSDQPRGALVLCDELRQSGEVQKF